MQALFMKLVAQCPMSENILHVKLLLKKMTNKEMEFHLAHESRV
jgi:hypothetical protein